MKLRWLAATAALTASAAVHGQPLTSSSMPDLRWRSIGPPRSGYVSAPAGVPGDPTTYYVGLPEGGGWKTTHGGTTWKPIFDAVHIASVGAVAVAPSDPGILYVGTGNQSGWSFTIGKGVYKSTDAGKTRTPSGVAAPHYPRAIFVDPRNAEHVLVAAEGPRVGGRGATEQALPANTERGVYRSTDGGRS